MRETKRLERKSQQAILDRVRKTLRSALADSLEEVEALGIFGSLARGSGFSEHSDIDVFVIVKETDSAGLTDQRWWQLIKQALEPFERDVTVLVYTVAGLRAVANWYVLRLATEGILVHDRGDIVGVFDEILEAAQRAGLVQERFGESLVWTLRPEMAGKPLEISVT